MTMLGIPSEEDAVSVDERACEVVGYFIHRPEEHAPHLTSPYGYAIAKVYTSRAAARGAHGPMRGDEKLYRVIEDEL